MTSIRVVNQAKTALKSNIKKLTPERSLFARYLIHVIGDIHQPLHSVSLFNHTYPKGDAGGNLIKLKVLNGSVQNFHSFWDSGAFILQNNSYKFVRPMNFQNTTQINRLAVQMIENYGKQVQEDGKILDPMIWVKQSFIIAQNTTYPFVMENNIATEQYTKLVYETAKKRITLAGYRLANYVIDIFDPTSTSKILQDQQIDKELFEISMQLNKNLWNSVRRTKNLISE